MRNEIIVDADDGENIQFQINKDGYCLVEVDEKGIATIDLSHIRKKRIRLTTDSIDKEIHLCVNTSIGTRNIHVSIKENGTIEILKTGFTFHPLP